VLLNGNEQQFEGPEHRGKVAASEPSDEGKTPKKGNS
jgi:hypothetical protein